MSRAGEGSARSLAWSSTAPLAMAAKKRYLTDLPMNVKSLAILVADDEADMRDLLQHWLVEAGHSVMVASSGTAAGRLVLKHSFDLVITDVLMADGDGLELIEQMKRSQPAARILAISGGGRYIEGDDCLKIARGFGAHWALMKPFNREQLLSSIAQTLAPKQESGF